MILLIHAVLLFANVDADRLVGMSLTGVKLGSLGAGHDSSHAGLRGHPGHRVDLERDNQYEFCLTKSLHYCKNVQMWVHTLVDRFYKQWLKGVVL